MDLLTHLLSNDHNELTTLAALLGGGGQLLVIRMYWRDLMGRLFGRKEDDGEEHP